jgi:hypothetical protein
MGTPVEAGENPAGEVVSSNEAHDFCPGRESLARNGGR